MSTEEPRAANVWFDHGKLCVALADGRELACPVSMFPRLAAASSHDQAAWELIGDGQEIHWAALDEDLSIRGLLHENLESQPKSCILRE